MSSTYLVLALTAGMAMACGNVKKMVIQGSGGTGKVNADTPTERAQSAPVSGTITYYASYDERQQTLYTSAWRPEGRQAPGTFSTNGVPMVTEYILDGYSYNLSQEGVEPAEVITATIRYEGDGPTRTVTASMPRISVGDSVTISKTGGASVAWLGSPLAEGEEVYVKVRREGSRYASEVDAWGKVGKTNTVLWIDGQTLRIPPHASWSDSSIPLEVGATYELWIERVQQPEFFSTAVYHSDSVFLELQP